MAQAFQTYESFRLVAGEALGGSKPKSSAVPEEAIGSWDELVSAFKGIGGTVH